MSGKSYRHDEITEITYALCAKSGSEKLTDTLSAISGVENVVLVQYNQES